MLITLFNLAMGIWFEDNFFLFFAFPSIHFVVLILLPGAFHFLFFFHCFSLCICILLWLVRLLRGCGNQLKSGGSAAQATVSFGDESGFRGLCSVQATTGFQIKNFDQFQSLPLVPPLTLPEPRSRAGLERGANGSDLQAKQRLLHRQIRKPFLHPQDPCQVKG